MSAIIRKSMQARCDLVDIADYLEQVGGLATAERFLAAVEQALDQLAGLPKMGFPVGNIPSEAAKSANRARSWIPQPCNLLSTSRRWHRPAASTPRLT